MPTIAQLAPLVAQQGGEIGKCVVISTLTVIVLGGIFIQRWLAQDWEHDEIDQQNTDRVLPARQTVATHFVLDFTGGQATEPLPLDGEVEGIPVRVWTDRTGNVERAVTRFRAELPEQVPPGMIVERRGSEWLKGIEQRRDILLGESDIDGAYVVDGPSDLAIREFLWTDGVTDALRELAEVDANVEIRDGAVWATQTGLLTDGEFGVEVLDDLVVFAKAVRRAVERDEQDEAAVSVGTGAAWETPD